MKANPNNFYALGGFSLGAGNFRVNGARITDMSAPLSLATGDVITGDGVGFLSGGIVGNPASVFLTYRRKRF